MEKLIKWLKWLDNNILKIFASIFIFFIPLYPKLPLKSIGYTYVSIRLEDLVVGLMLIIFVIQLIRRKVTLNRNFLILFIVFWVAVFASFIFNVYITKIIHYRQLAFLNAGRRFEYMWIFFLFLNIVKSKKELLHYLKLFILAFFIVVVYGIGQKFLGWPAVQTMNPAYAKGYLLFLTPEARISSTFSGHYDLAAYLIMFMPIVLGLFFFKSKLRYFLLFIIALFSLILTASRISFGAYLATTLPFLVFLKKPKYLLIVVVLTTIFTLSSKNLTSRITRTFQMKQIFVNQETGQVVIPQKISSKEVPAGSLYYQVNNNGSQSPIVAGNEALARERILDQIRTEARGKGQILTKLEEDAMAASIAAMLKPINTVVTDISFATRLQIEWPRAIQAFLKNPIFGTGPSSITEATDNDYLRWLGEFGLFGTIPFVLILGYIVKIIINYIRKTKNNDKLIYLGFLFGFVALLFNATYIDVFEASKIAFIFWSLTGIFIGPILYEKI